MKLLYCLVILAPLLVESATTPADGPEHLTRLVPTVLLCQSNCDSGLRQSSVQSPTLAEANQEDNQPTTAAVAYQRSPVDWIQGELSAGLTGLSKAGSRFLGINTQESALLTRKAAKADRVQKDTKTPAADKANSTSELSLEERYGGQARISLAADPYGVFQKKASQQSGSGNLFRWSVDYSQTLHNSAESTWLLEISGRTQGGLYLASGGLVARYKSQNGQLVGVNLFIDQDLSGAQTRGSLGVEWLGLAANVYTPLSGWKMSDQPLPFFCSDPNGYNRWVQPASGLDVSFEGALPYTPLSIKASHSYWLGDDIGTTGPPMASAFAGHNRTFSVMASWQPVPLCKVSASRIFVPRSSINSWVIVQFYFDLGRPLGNLFHSTSTVTSTPARSRDGRYRFANRNREMILTYQKRAPVVTKPGYGVTFYPTDGADVSKDQVGQLLAKHDAIQIILPDWPSINSIDIPTGEQFHNKVVTVARTSNSSVQVKADGKEVSPALNKNEDFTLRNVQGKWYLGAINTLSTNP